MIKICFSKVKSCIETLLSETPATLIFTNRYYIRRAWLPPPTPAHAQPESPTPAPAQPDPPAPFAAPRMDLLVHNLTNAVALDFHWERYAVLCK